MWTPENRRRYDRSKLRKNVPAFARLALREFLEFSLREGRCHDRRASIALTKSEVWANGTAAMSGDVFDSRGPSAAAERAVFRFFRRVGRAGAKMLEPGL